MRDRSRRYRSIPRGAIVAAVAILLALAGFIVVTAARTDDPAFWQLFALCSSIAGILSLLVADMLVHWQRDLDDTASREGLAQGPRARRRVSKRAQSRDAWSRSLGHAFLLIAASCVLGLFVRSA